MSAAADPILPVCSKCAVNACAIFGDKGVVDILGMSSFQAFKSLFDRYNFPLVAGLRRVMVAKRYDISCLAAGEKSLLKTNWI